MKRRVRTFVAVEISEAVRGAAAKVIRRFGKCDGDLKWVEPEQMHLTLKFLGDVEEALLPGLVTALEAAAAEVPPFMFDTTSMGAFPSPARPRVVWLGVESTPGLYDLQEAVERELTPLGFPREKRRFHPHITLGRIRDAGAVPHDARLPALIAKLPVPRGRTAADELVLIESTLSPRGARHETLEIIRLGGAEADPRH
jgi:2'-5' RNA ligase